MSDLPLLPSVELRKCHKCGNKTLKDISFVLGSVHVKEKCSTCNYSGNRQLHRRQVQSGAKTLDRCVPAPTTRYAHEYDDDPMADLRKKWQDKIP